MKQTVLILSVLTVLLFGCGHGGGSDAPPAADPVYKASILDMQVSGSTTTTAGAPKFKNMLYSAGTVSVQHFYSGDVLSTAYLVGVDVTVQNDSDVPMRPMFMIYWDPAGYPYDPAWVDTGLIKMCGTPFEELQPGGTVVYQYRAGIPLTEPSLLGPQELSAYVYAATNPDMAIDCFPDPWSGTLQSLKDYIASHEPLAVGTNHFTIVAP